MQAKSIRPDGCGIRKFEYRAEAWGIGTKKLPDLANLKIEPVVSRFSSSAIFLKDYRRELPLDERVTVILYGVLLRLANLSPIEMNYGCPADGERVERTIPFETGPATSVFTPV
jgi:hypothetical protein